MSDLGDWYSRVPVFTKWWFTGTIALSLAGRLELISGYYLYLLLDPIISSFEIWRPITAVFYYPINPNTGFHFLINCYFLYHYSRQLESIEYAGRPADYLLLLIFNWICCVTMGLIIQLPLLMDAMVLSVLYVWCQLNYNTIVTFWFGTRFKAMYLPWVLFGFNFIIAGGGISELIGILAGHAYCFLKFTFPQEYGGRSWLTTPSIFYQWFPNEGGVHGFGAPPPAAAAAPARHAWGTGRVLGGRAHVD